MDDDLERPVIQFKAGLCDFDEDTKKVKPLPEKGLCYLWFEGEGEDKLIHLSWRPRTMPLSIATFESPLDLLMIPGDGTFTPIQPSSTPPQSPSNGRFFRLRFESSSEKKFFWLQAEGDKEDGKKFSERDLKIGTVVDRILRGEDVDVKAEFESVGGLRAAGEGGNGDRRDSEGDVEMSTGGAGEGATGGDAREEGEESRQGGGDGARA